MASVPMVEVMRGGMVESVHRGHAVVCDASGAVIAAWGDPGATVLPRSSSKLFQALPLVESGAAEAAGLGSEHLALACASHEGEAIHTRRVADWLAAREMGEADLRCGAHMPTARDAAHDMIRRGEAPTQFHNNCSGKHAGFLTLARHLRAGPEYIDIDHPVQRAVRAAWEEVTGEESPGYGIDGCSAPNFATSLAGVARGMASFAAAAAGDTAGARSEAQAALVRAMMAHPELVAGERRACTRLMRAMRDRAAVKTGAEAFFVAVLPEKRLGIALKIEDGATRASEAAIAALLVRFGVLDADDPVAAALNGAPIRNWRGIETGSIRAVI